MPSYQKFQPILLVEEVQARLKSRARARFTVSAFSISF